MTDSRSPVTTGIIIDDGPGRAARSTRCRARADAGHVVLSYERRDGSEGTITVPNEMLRPCLELTDAPTLMEAYTVGGGPGGCGSLGPFVRRDTADMVAKGRGEEGTTATVIGPYRYVTWRDSDGTHMGLQVVADKPTVLSHASPDEAAVAAILGSLEPEQRLIMERALGRH